MKSETLAWKLNEGAFRLGVRTATVAYNLIRPPTDDSRLFRHPLYRRSQKKREEHTLLLGKPGSGKTTLLHSLIFHALQGVRQGKQGLILIDSQGLNPQGLIAPVLNLKLWEDELLQEKLVIIDPARTPSFNLFGINLRDLPPEGQEECRNAVIEFLLSLMTDLFEAELSMYQKNCLIFCTKALLQRPRASFLDFLTLLDDPEPFASEIGRLSEIDQQFFARDLLDKTTYRNTRAEIRARLMAALSHNAFRELFLGDGQPFDALEVLSSPKILCVSTNKGLLGEKLCKVFGKTVIQLLVQAMFRRGNRRGWQGPVELVIDEAQDYLDSSTLVSTLISQGRKYHVPLTLGTQSLAKFGRGDEELQDAVLSVGTKVVGKVDIKSAKVLAPHLHVEPEAIEGLRKSRKTTEFLVFIDDITSSARKVTLPLGYVHRKPQLSQEAWRQFLSASCSPPEGHEKDALVSGEVAASSEPKHETPPAEPDLPLADW